MIRRRRGRPGRAPEPLSSVRFELDGPIARITLAWRKRDNRFSPAMAVAFSEACSRCEDESRVVLLTAEGGNFCRGVDASFEGCAELPAVDFVAALARLGRPVIASIRGRAEAEGLELALAADLRIVAPDVSLSLPQVSRGGLPRFGGTQRLPRIVGSERALRMILLGERVRGREAVAMGLAMAVDPRPDRAAEALARELAARGPIALRFAKEAVRRAQDLALDDGARFEHDLYSLLQTTADRAEGIRAFLEKRKPVFRGE